MLCGSFFFQWYFNKCGLNCWFLWNAMLTKAQAILCFNVFNFRRAIDSLVYWMKRFFWWFLNWHWLRFAFSWLSRNSFFKNAFFERSFSHFIDEVPRFKGLAWLNIVGILSDLRLNLHTPLSNSPYKRKNTKICKIVLFRNVQFFKGNPNSW